MKIRDLKGPPAAPLHQQLVSHGVGSKRKDWWSVWAHGASRKTDRANEFPGLIKLA